VQSIILTEVIDRSLVIVMISCSFHDIFLISQKKTSRQLVRIIAMRMPYGHLGMSCLTKKVEMPAMGSCSRSAKWAWDRPGGGCVWLHKGLMRTTIGSHLQPAVAEIKEWSIAPHLFHLF